MADRLPDDGTYDEDIPELGDADAGDTAGWVDPADGEVDYAANDPIAAADFADELVTNDAAAGETVLPGPGIGPTGGMPREASPILDEHDPQEEVDEGVLTEEDVEEEGI
ncbi:hypothetical protein [Leifsonia poae]|uniref:DUF5709 domain-containing protein n=1 Tax=Leifsonia poae TaxID=110933 RepID=A0A9W6LYL0_9MICO|nr:hypothetical protein [Leifsonia poae]GLJ74714.1 hypothetical protein GCM10017584_02870 [Leifsonia poae]